MQVEIFYSSYLNHLSQEQMSAARESLPNSDDSMREVNDHVFKLRQFSYETGLLVQYSSTTFATAESEH